MNKADFTNSTSINVTRQILVNNWAYATVTDKINITSDAVFNAFEYTIPSDFYMKVDHFDLTINSQNNTHVQPTAFTKDTNNNTVATFVFNTNTTEKANATLTITMGVNDLVSINEGNTSYPFSVSGINFLPWFNFPINRYNFRGGIISYDTVASVKNDTYAPVPADLGLTAKPDQDFSISSDVLAYSTMTHLPDFAYSTVSSEYSNKGDEAFIPAFEPKFQDNVTFPVQYGYLIHQSPIKYLNSEVSISISQWGDVKYVEKTTMESLGPKTFPVSGSSSDPASIPVYINANKITSLSVYDNFGNLSSTTSALWTSQQGYPTNVTILKIAPRSALIPNNPYTYTLTYTIPADRFLNETEGVLSPSWDVKLPAMSLFNWTNRHVDLTVSFPALSSVSLPDRAWGVPISGANLTSEGFFGLNGVVLSLSLDNFSSIDNVFAKIHFSVPMILGPTLPVIQNAVYLFFIGLLIIVVRVAVQRYSGIVEVESKGDQSIPFELMRDFVTAYEEKTALRSRLTELEKKRKNLRKVEFDQRVQTLKNKQRANDKKLVAVTSELMKVSSVYKESIHSLELAEAERDQILSQIADLEEKKKASRIRPEIYKKLKSDQNNKLNKAITRIERVLNELRSLLRESR